MKNNILIFSLGIVLAAIPLIDFQNFSKANKYKTSSALIHELRVMSYNIHHANPPSKEGVIDLDAIIETIKTEDPDLVALQEIDVNTQRSGQGNQAQRIGDALRMHVFFGKAINFESGEYGVAILSKFPITDSKIHKLRSSPDTNGEPRVLATVKVALPDGSAILFYSTHLDAQKADTNRLLQIEDINTITSKETLPLIIAGDFNAIAGTPVIDSLDRHFKRTCESCAPTIPVNAPEKAIDFIAFRPKNKFSVKDHRVISKTYASDHLPILAIIEF